MRKLKVEPYTIEIEDSGRTGWISGCGKFIGWRVNGMNFIVYDESPPLAVHRALVSILQLNK